jgi:hypothetical protein
MTSSIITTKDFESTLNSSEVLKPIENLGHRKYTIYLPYNVFKLIKLFIIFAEQTPVDKNSAGTAIKYAFSAS